MDIQVLAREWAEIKRRVTERESQQAEDKSRLAELERTLLALCNDCGIQSITLKDENDGRMTVSMRTDIYASVAKGGDDDGRYMSREDALEYLAQCEDTRHLVRPAVNGNSLSAYVRERIGNGDELSEEFLRAVHVSRAQRLSLHNS